MATAATYSQYSLHYAKLAEKELVNGEAAGDGDVVEAEVEEGERSSPGRKRKAASRSKSPEAKKQQAPAKVGALAMLSGYGSDSGGSD